MKSIMEVDASESESEINPMIGSVAKPSMKPALDKSQTPVRS
jgi:hypothetical protein